ncbi:MAG: histidine phosphatase family protein [Rickettsiales bacterium TMED174]|nr:MAG: histidine phosphatase family protein [Rickettsiales bacterium TMED174]|tara:strand:+ start:467 stop:1036 length:570 start_codon:yes stop_codon:yes gene_type:complete
MKDKHTSLINFLIGIFSILIFQPLHSSEKAWKVAAEGNKIIFIRHSLAPGGGDPPGFKLKDCKTQRNLNEAGINQSRAIGRLFKKNNIPIDQVLSSQWCRCKDTAKYAFKDYKEFPALNSTFQAAFAKNQTKQLKQLKKFVNNWSGEGGNLVFVTHYSIITAITNAVPSSGEIVITDKKFNVLNTIVTD